MQNDNNEVKFDKTNVQAELLFCGSLYKEPDLYLSYGESTRSKFDFSDSATRFFYDLFEEYYLTFSQDISQGKINNFATQNSERLKLYKNYGGWKTIQSMMDIADPMTLKTYIIQLKSILLLESMIETDFLQRIFYLIRIFNT